MDGLESDSKLAGRYGVGGYWYFELCVGPAAENSVVTPGAAGAIGSGGGGSGGAVTLELELALEGAGAVGPVGTGVSVWW